VPVTLIALAGLVRSVLLAQSNPFIGTWKQDMAKSKYAPGVPAAPNRTITYESQSGDQIYQRRRAGPMENTWPGATPANTTERIIRSPGPERRIAPISPIPFL